MHQSRLMSLVEAVANVVVGLIVALAAQIVVFPVLGLRATLGQNIKLALVLTGVSVARSYVLRRLFEGWRWSTWRQSLLCGARADEPVRTLQRLVLGGGEDTRDSIDGGAAFFSAEFAGSTFDDVLDSIARAGGRAVQLDLVSAVGDDLSRGDDPDEIEDVRAALAARVIEAAALTGCYNMVHPTSRSEPMGAIACRP